jgi:NAD(P)-dependent dehydrogenase (short-subunit alcohol dehydrogenase family)
MTTSSEPPADNSAARLDGSVVIVTGSASGIGRATCERLVREGARLVVVDLDGLKTANVVERLTAEGAKEVLGLPLSVRSEEDMETMARRTLERFGRIDILIHCAGILRGKPSNPRMLAELSTEEWDDVVATNLRGTFLANRAVLAAMIKQRSGQILNISSTSGRQGFAFASAYSASKFGVIGLSESLADEVRTYGIKVQVLCPGAVSTPLWDQNVSIQAPEHALPPERVADLIAYLVTLPPDTVLQNVVVIPSKLRRRKKAARARERAALQEEREKP